MQPGSINHTTSSAIARVLKEKGGLNTLVQATAGESVMIAIVGRGEADFAMANAPEIGMALANDGQPNLRVIGAVYLLPFLFFLWRGALSGELKRRLWLIFTLGALQGAVGWWMVASGLSHRTEVSQYRLAAHLMLALIIFAAIVWTLRRFTVRPHAAAPPRLKVTGIVLLGLTFLQIYFGALVAGLRPALPYDALRVAA